MMLPQLVVESWKSEGDEFVSLSPQYPTLPLPVVGMFDTLLQIDRARGKVDMIWDV